MARAIDPRHETASLALCGISIRDRPPFYPLSPHLVTLGRNERIMQTGKQKRPGGRREPPGGRPPKGNIRLVCYIKPETRNVIDRVSAGWGVTLGEVLDAIVAPMVRDEDRSSTT